MYLCVLGGGRGGARARVRFAVWNKGTAFSQYERDALGLRGVHFYAARAFVCWQDHTSRVLFKCC
jgi:hypothetical protein